MANVRRFDVVATYDGKLDIAEQDEDNGLYCRAPEALAEIERLRAALVIVGNHLFKKVDSQFICVGMVSWQRLDEASEVINDVLEGKP